MYPIFTRVHTRTRRSSRRSRHSSTGSRPSSIVASGDLTHRGRRDAARAGAPVPALVRRPVLAVPGNHDLPYTFPGALHAAVGRVRAAVGDDRADALLPRRCTSSASTRRAPTGTRAARCAPRSSTSAAERLAGGARTARTASSCSTTTCSARRGARRASGRCRAATRCCARSSRAGADLILAGHIHQAARERAARVRGRRGRRARRGRLDRAGARPAAPEPARRGARPARLRGRRADAAPSRRYIWRGGDWGLTAQRVFPRGLGPLAVETRTSRQREPGPVSGRCCTKRRYR